jgi:hypothetical protein
MEISIKENGCTDKKCFSTKHEATKRVLEIRDEENLKEKEDRETIPVRAYKCKKCRMWHLTSVPAKEWKNIKQKIRKTKKQNNPFSLDVRYWKSKLGVDDRE